MAAILRKVNFTCWRQDMALIESEKKASYFAMAITWINVLVASGFSIVGQVAPKLMLPANSILTGVPDFTSCFFLDFFTMYS
jgi:hypothetical protein